MCAKQLEPKTNPSQLIFFAEKTRSLDQLNDTTTHPIPLQQPLLPESVPNGLHTELSAQRGRQIQPQNHSFSPVSGTVTLAVASRQAPSWAQIADSPQQSPT